MKKVLVTFIALLSLSFSSFAGSYNPSRNPEDYEDMVENWENYFDYEILEDYWNTYFWEGYYEDELLKPETEMFKDENVKLEEMIENYEKDSVCAICCPNQIADFSKGIAYVVADTWLIDCDGNKINVGPGDVVEVLRVYPLEAGGKFLEKPFALVVLNNYRVGIMNTYYLAHDKSNEIIIGSTKYYLLTSRYINSYKGKKQTYVGSYHLVSEEKWGTSIESKSLNPSCDIILEDENSGFKLASYHDVFTVSFENTVRDPQNELNYVAKNSKLFFISENKYLIKYGDFWYLDSSDEENKTIETQFINHTYWIYIVTSEKNETTGYMESTRSEQWEYDENFDCIAHEEFDGNWGK